MNTLRINVSAEGNRGSIQIIGNISEWNRNNSSDYRRKCEELKNSGVTHAHIYLNTSGGDCIQANEIVNITNEFFPGYTGEGGALVASAGTYIAANCTTFELARNGQFMIHKPSGFASGNEQEVENYLKLLKNMTQTYYNAYKAKLKKPEAEFKEKWDKGDFWMTAEEAKEWGFVTNIKEAVDVDEQTTQALRACGCPGYLDNQDDNNQNPKSKMNIQIFAMAVGLPDTATETEITAKIADLKAKASKYDTLKAEVEAKEKAEKTEKIKTKLDGKIADKSISADTRPKWEASLEKDFEGTMALLDTMQPVEKLPITPGANTQSGTYQGKTYEQLQDENPELLAELYEKNSVVYESLFADFKKRNNIQ